MFHLSRTIAFIACLAAAVLTEWYIGLICLAAAMLFIPNPNRMVK